MEIVSWILESAERLRDNDVARNDIRILMPCYMRPVIDKYFEEHLVTFKVLDIEAIRFHGYYTSFDSPSHSIHVYTREWCSKRNELKSLNYSLDVSQRGFDR